MSRERDFHDWVSQRLGGWPTGLILDLERWLLDEGEFEFIPAVSEVLADRDAVGGVTRCGCSSSRFGRRTVTANPRSV
jgi:hypothetical protein